MKKRFQEKKGVLFSLESLLGLILSVLALIVMFNAISPLLLPTAPNFDIAQKNSDSIVNFVNYFETSKIYSSYESCYGSLKLERMQNYQIENEEIYFYIIDSEGIHIIEDQFYEKIISEGSFENIKKRTTCFSDSVTGCQENIIKLGHDETDQGEIISISLEFFNFGNFDKYLEINELEQDSFIVLKPSFSNQNTYEIEIFDTGNRISCLEVAANTLSGIASEDTCKRVNSGLMKVELEGKNLVYDKDKNLLFVTGGPVSDIHLQKNLCFLRDLNTRDLFRYYSNNPEEIDYLNNNIIISSSKSLASFEWKREPICKIDSEEISCKEIDEDLFSQVDDQLQFTYNTFLNTIISYYEQNIDNFERKDLNVRVKPLSQEEFFQVDRTPKFTEIFEESNMWTADKTSSWKEENGIYSIERIFGKIPFNDCDQQYCKDVFFESNQVYFFINEKGKFYKFKHHNLRKEDDGRGNIKIFYSGNQNQGEIFKEIAYNKDTTADQWGVGGDEKELYRVFNIESLDNLGNIVSYEILLTERQFDSIPLLGDTNE